MNRLTFIPSWTLDPIPGVGEYEVNIPGSLASSLRHFADEMRLPLTTVLLMTHAKVISVITGEIEVVIGYATDANSVWSLRLDLGLSSWRELLTEIAKTEAEFLMKRDQVIESGQGSEITEMLYESVFDLTTEGVKLTDGIVMKIAFGEDDELVFKLIYRTEIMDRSCAARIASYHIKAIKLLLNNPESNHTEYSLVSSEELNFQIHGLAGRKRNLPDRRVHELFEDQVKLHPDNVAAIHGSTKLTYMELNKRANRIAQALLVHGLIREGVVGVVTERNLDWMAAVLAIFKAGGVYLPIEPQFPAERIVKTLARADCRLVLTESGSNVMLDLALEKLSGVETIIINKALAENLPDSNPGIPVAPDQLAYIYFTSGSTGEPKGVMCEHEGMLNHMLAKIDDLDICTTDIIAQTAPQCFDISLWQLISPLLAGGQTLIVEQEVILDAPRFIDTIKNERVNIFQVVPSYLEVLQSYLGNYALDLPDLRIVVVTGEVLKMELVQRWFAVQPGIILVNAYGLTETSDDTNHEILESIPLRERVPLGRPVNNVYIYIVDDQLLPVPLGAPGEIIFSGVCVGRGYVNDPIRTKRVFIEDRFRPGQRMYRSGDFGRWLPDGRLEYLGRRDNQVKVSGFRIEIGEVENKLLKLQGLRECAVVVTESSDRTTRLVAFYTGDKYDTAELQDRLGESLPKYMVPSAFIWQQDLLLTGNGKIDKKELSKLAGNLDVLEENREEMRTATEHWLVSAWSDVLGVPKDRIGRQDQFFELGGTSLSALRLVIALERTVTLKDIIAHPVLTDLAKVIDERGIPTASKTVLQNQCAVTDMNSINGGVK